MRLGVLAKTLAMLMFVGLPFAATAGPSPDMDSDGTADVFDFCKLDATAPTPCGLDDDKDGYGNACDCDLNNDTLVNGLDFNQPGLDNDFLDCFLNPLGDVNGIGCDFNCDTLVDGLDFLTFLPHFIAGTPPGPSGLPCAGTVPCHP